MKLCAEGLAAMHEGKTLVREEPYGKGTIRRTLKIKRNRFHDENGMIAGLIPCDLVAEWEIKEPSGKEKE